MPPAAPFKKESETNKRIRKIMANESSSKSSGIGLTGVLFVVFLVLKLCHVIDWSWWWVTAPLWIPVCILILFMIGFVIYEKGEAKRSRKRLKQRIDAFNQERQQILDEKRKKAMED